MGKMDWFHEARYGMFIHWGAYSVAGRGEWIMNREMISKEEYTEKYVNNWKAENYDPKQWADLAAEAGMKYMVLTSRHHDGFALWDTKATDFNAARLGPKKDLIAPYVEAVRGAGLKVGLYYSPAAWSHPDYPGPFFRDWPGAEDWASEEARQRFIEYYRTEVNELLRNYGAIDVLWYDGCVPQNLDGEETNTSLQQDFPDLVINERNGKPYDYECSEQAIKPAASGMPWEACMTLNGHWGYHAGDHDYKAPVDVITMLLTTAKSAGNLLLNVGPKPDGTIPVESIDILKESGQWVRRNRESITNSDRCELSWNNVSMMTCRGNTVYHHFRHHPGRTFCWAEVSNDVKRAWWLATGDEVTFRRDRQGRIIFEDLPLERPDDPVATMAVELDGEPRPITARTTFWIPG